MSEAQYRAGGAPLMSTSHSQGVTFRSAKGWEDAESVGYDRYGHLGLRGSEVGKLYVRLPILLG